MSLLYDVESLIESKELAVKTLKDIDRDLSNEEHVNSDWIEDCIELNSGIGIVERSHFRVEIKKLKADLKRERECVDLAGVLIGEVEGITKMDDDRIAAIYNEVTKTQENREK